MKRILISLVFVCSASANAGDTLTGTVRLACEAILCLSSSTTPSECNPALNYYFSINHRKFTDTIKARFNFLNLCPSSSEPGMPALTRAISRGAGHCDAAGLNKDLAHCDFGEGGGPCVISNQMPEYCSVYYNHEFTRLNVPHYDPNARIFIQGYLSMPNGFATGGWVD